jgi:hypothetical protein
MSQKEKINYYPFVELPDPKIRYLIRDEKSEPIAVFRFDDDGTQQLRYLRPVSPDYEAPMLDLMNEKRRLLFGL